MGYDKKEIDVTIGKGLTDLGNVEMQPDNKNTLREVLVTGSMPPSQIKAMSIFFNALKTEYGSVETFIQKERGVGESESIILKKKYTI